MSIELSTDTIGPSFNDKAYSFIEHLLHIDQGILNNRIPEPLRSMVSILRKGVRNEETMKAASGRLAEFMRSRNVDTSLFNAHIRGIELLASGLKGLDNILGEFDAKVRGIISSRR